jgi:fatty acid desaturase
LFAADRRINKLAGRAMAILFGSSYRVLRFGHLTHHRFSRHPLDRPDCFDPKVTSAWIGRLRFFAELCGGLYVTEIALPLLGWLPKRQIHRLFDRVYAGEDPRLQALRQLAKQALGSDRAVAEVRQDSALIILTYGSAFALWGNLWWLLVCFILIRGLMISFLDNVYHFRTPVDDPDFALNLSLPLPFQALILNMNFHRLHHHNMHLPWWSLPRQFASSGAHFDGSYFRAALAQLAGPAPIEQLTSQKSAENHCAPKLCID